MELIALAVDFQMEMRPAAARLNGCPIVRVAAGIADGLAGLDGLSIGHQRLLDMNVTGIKILADEFHGVLAAARTGRQGLDGSGMGGEQCFSGRATGAEIGPRVTCAGIGPGVSRSHPAINSMWRVGDRPGEVEVTDETL